MMFLDVVYNHFGPEGNYLGAYAAPFFTERHHTAWGAAINFDGGDARPVRDFFIHNALYWLEEFRFDGLRFDAVHAIVDDSKPHILKELAEAIRSGPGAEREIHLVLENDHNQARFLEYRDAATPRWYDAQWDDDLHHAFHVLLTGEKDGYYTDYADQPARHVGRCLTEGFAYQGDPSPYRDSQPRGEPSKHLPPAAFVTFLQNHDQVGNRAVGERLPALTSAQRLRAATAAWLLAPSPPMLFMGEEFAASTPFLFFCDFGPELAKAVTEGRRREFGRFNNFGESEVPDPNEPSTFERSKLDWGSLDEEGHRQWLELYRTILRTRTSHIVPRLAGMQPGHARYAVVSDAALVASWRLADGSRLEIRLNLSERELSASAPPRGELLHCEPGAAENAFRAARLPPDSAAIYLDSSHGATS
jgi:malto-oligosyltrehalose trehalohydrolase